MIPLYGVRFENDVEMYGAQTKILIMVDNFMFENDVEMYGAQTIISLAYPSTGLRMM